VTLTRKTMERKPRCVLVTRRTGAHHTDSPNDHHDRGRPVTATKRSLSMKSQPSFVDLALATPQPKPPTPAVSHGSEPEIFYLHQQTTTKQRKKNKQTNTTGSNTGGTKPPLATSQEDKNPTSRRLEEETSLTKLARSRNFTERERERKRRVCPFLLVSCYCP
jgi:hypothetical protein